VSSAWSYYRAVEGAWRAPFELQIVDARALAGLDALVRFGFVTLARLCAVGVRPWLETSVAVGSDEVLHTTRVRLGWFTLFRSVEHLRIASDGASVSLHGTQRSAPFYRALPLEGHARVEGTGARYDLAWFGTRMDQSATYDAEAQTVPLVQRTPFSTGTQVLRRR
jgi:hypothetical protein